MEHSVGMVWMENAANLLELSVRYRRVKKIRRSFFAFFFSSLRPNISVSSLTEICCHLRKRKYLSSSPVFFFFFFFFFFYPLSCYLIQKKKKRFKIKLFILFIQLTKTLIQYEFFHSSVASFWRTLC